MKNEDLVTQARECPRCCNEISDFRDVSCAVCGAALPPAGPYCQCGCCREAATKARTARPVAEGCSCADYAPDEKCDCPYCLLVRDVSVVLQHRPQDLCIPERRFTISKFDSVYAEAAHRVSLDGTGDYLGSVDEMGHYSYVSFSSTYLATFGDADLVTRFHQEVNRDYGEGNTELVLYFIIREDDQGFVTLILMTPNEDHANKSWETIGAEYDKYWNEQETEA